MVLDLEPAFMTFDILLKVKLVHYCYNFEWLEFVWRTIEIFSLPCYPPYSFAFSISMETLDPEEVPPQLFHGSP